MNFSGSTISHPFRPDQRGTLATINTGAEIISESITAILEIRQGERVMMPDYGIPDYVFEVIDAGFAARLAYSLEEQIKRYEPLVERVKVTVGIFDDGRFESGVTTDPHRAAVRIVYTERGSNTTRNLIFPTWSYTGLAAAN